MKNIAKVLVFGLLLSGCAAQQLQKNVDTTRRALIVGADLYNTAASALMAARDAEESSLLAKVQSGEMAPETAQTAYQVWMARGKQAATALDVFRRTCQTANDVALTVSAGGTGDLPGALSNILKAWRDAAGALAQLGITIPGGF